MGAGRERGQGGKGRAARDLVHRYIERIAAANGFEQCTDTRVWCVTRVCVCVCVCMGEYTYEETWLT